MAIILILTRPRGPKTWSEAIWWIGCSYTYPEYKLVVIVFFKEEDKPIIVIVKEKDGTVVLGTEEEETVVISVKEDKPIVVALEQEGEEWVGAMGGSICETKKAKDTLEDLEERSAQR